MSDPTQQQPDAGGQPDQGGAPAGPQGSEQANGLQKLLADWMHTTQQIAQQNAVIAPEMQEITTSLRKAFLKTIQAANPPQQQTQAPPGQ